MKIRGVHTDNGLIRYRKPVRAVQVGETLRDAESGSILAVKDCYGHWISPAMINAGIKQLLEVTEK